MDHQRRAGFDLRAAFCCDSNKTQILTVVRNLPLTSVPSAGVRENVGTLP
jgi:hypothetical protein